MLPAESPPAAAGRARGAPGSPHTEAPATYAELAELLRAASAAGETVRPSGGGTKWDWGNPLPPPDLVLSTGRLAGVVEYNPDDLTAVVQAGMPLDALQELLADCGQMLALDPPGAAAGTGAATIGGIVATADSGPLRHSCGGVRDLVLGVAVALTDGSVARAGGKVIKNVAGYDLAKLYTGSFGTLGVIAEVAVRLHPRPAERRTVVGRAVSPAALQAAVLAIMAVPVSPQALDVAWAPAAAGGGPASAGAPGRGAGPAAGSVVVAVAGPGRAERAGRVRRLMESAGLAVEEPDGDASLWAGQRAAQRAAAGAVVKVSSLPSRLAEVIGALPQGAGLVGRAGLGLSWVRLPAAPDPELAGAVVELRRRLAPQPCALLDAPAAVRSAAGAWGPIDPGRAALQRRIRERFDPAGILNAGVL
jgi:glycolate oxidase FAD binding subunit